MNEKALNVLEFNKILAALSGFAVSPMGKELAKELRPSRDIGEINTAQDETTAAVSMVLRKGAPPFGGFTEIRPQLTRAGMGGALNPKELLDIGRFLYVCGKASRYGTKEAKDESRDILEGFFEYITEIPFLEREINLCILSETEISDNASRELRDIRREIRISNDKIKDSLTSIINSGTYRTMLQDYVITIRNNRYCVPVKVEYRNSFPGMVHDQSNSGSTLFIEPMSVVQLNNKIKELEAGERAEIEKILLRLSEMVEANIFALNSNLDILMKLDFIFAKAALSLSMNGTRPVLNTRGYINIKKGRHPLLDKETVVPTDIYLGGEFTALIITGPNTGGKTVALKTLGLFTLMGQAGLNIPAFDNSELAVFDEVFADIGDEQSIEQSLSTFSSHMSNIVSILDGLCGNSLVLLDELGAGTDPTEGAALATAIIDYLMGRNVRIAVTTHYSELKVYALSTKGIENASCEFDVATLRPTYRLLIGVPGKSNAFAISERLGLKKEIINRAGEFITADETRFEDVITDLEISRKTLELEKERAEELRRESELMKKSMESQREKLAMKQEKALFTAREEARKILFAAKEDADRIIKEMNREAREKSGSGKLNAGRQELKNKLAEATEALVKSSAGAPRAGKPVKDARPGDRVHIMSFGQRGVVVSPAEPSGEVMVRMGNIKLKVPLGDLAEDAHQEKKQSGRVSTGVRAGKSQAISPEIDCRGQTVDEGLGNIDKYIDDAYLAGLKKVTIIHGKGTGALRAAVQSYLRTNPHVNAFRYGMYGEGETGVTIVELK